jgi:hypothetical protein
MLRLSLIALGIGALVSFAALVATDVVLPWPNAINVPDMPLEQWRAMSDHERREAIQSGAAAMKSLAGAEKIAYLLRATPWLFLLNWLLFFVPCVVAAFLAGLLVRGRRAP